MKAPKGIVRPRRHKVTIELTDVQASALLCLTKRIFRGQEVMVAAHEQVALSRCAGTMLAVALGDLDRLLTVSDTLVSYCEQESLTTSAARAAVYDDRVVAAFRSLPWKTSTKRGAR